MKSEIMLPACSLLLKHHDLLFSLMIIQRRHMSTLPPSACEIGGVSHFLAYLHELSFRALTFCCKCLDAVQPRHFHIKSIPTNFVAQRMRPANLEKWFKCQYFSGICIP